MITLVVTIGWFILQTATTPAMASPVGLAKIHFEVTKGMAPHLVVSSVEEANDVLANQSNGVLPVPELPGSIKSCCLHAHAGTTLTCAVIEKDGHLITVAIADAEKLDSPTGNTVRRADRKFTVHNVNGINMVMAQDENRWLCVMGDVETEVLLDVASQIAF